MTGNTSVFILAKCTFIIYYQTILFSLAYINIRGNLMISREYISGSHIVYRGHCDRYSQEVKSIIGRTLPSVLTILIAKIFFFLESTICNCQRSQVDYFTCVFVGNYYFLYFITIILSIELLQHWNLGSKSRASFSQPVPYSVLTREKNSDAAVYR